MKVSKREALLMIQQYEVRYDSVRKILHIVIDDVSERVRFENLLFEFLYDTYIILESEQTEHESYYQLYRFK